MKNIILGLIILTFLSYKCSGQNDKISTETIQNQLNEHNEIAYAISGKVKNPDRFDFEADTILCTIDKLNFAITPKGLLKWGENVKDSVQLKTDVYVERAYFHLTGNILYVFYTETDFEGATSRVEKIDIDKKQSIWQTEIYGFNLGLPYITSNFVYLTTIGSVGKLNMNNGLYEFQFKNLYDNTKYSFNNFDTIIFKDSLTMFLSRNFHSKRIDSVIINEKTKDIKIRK